jgi:hypothetical protein
VVYQQGVNKVVELQEAINALAKCSGIKVRAANLLGIPVNTFKDRLVRAKKNGIEATVSSVSIPKPAIKKNPNPPAAKPTSKGIRVLAIGDSHDDPSLSKDRFYWLGAHAEATGAEHIVQIGDFMTIDSLNTHIPNETLQGKFKNPFMTDVQSGAIALNYFYKGLKGHKAKQHITLGNHERRAWLYEDANPESEGLLTGQLNTLFKQAGWTTTPYGEFYFIDGVGFVHAALNRLGKTYGGKTAEATIANDAVFDIVVGHSHVGRSWRSPKIGPRQFLNVLNLGCALPYNHIEAYALHSTTGWTYGCYDLLLVEGNIEAAAFVSMLDLESKYGG